jgi:hypothetical protein
MRPREIAEYVGIWDPDVSRRARKVLDALFEIVESDPQKWYHLAVELLKFVAQLEMRHGRSSLSSGSSVLSYEEMIARRKAGS